MAAIHVLCRAILLALLVLLGPACSPRPASADPASVGQAPAPQQPAAQQPAAQERGSSRTPPPTKAPRPQKPAGSESVALDRLPTEARETVRLIEKGGPFPYAKDGTEFQNREGRLPKKPRAYYAEFTVRTPGANDRGARRIVKGASGELWYTDDHYGSFRWVDVP